MRNAESDAMYIYFVICENPTSTYEVYLMSNRIVHSPRGFSQEIYRLLFLVKCGYMGLGQKWNSVTIHVMVTRAER